MEEKIKFQSGDLQLEGLFNMGSGSRGVVITHPHPQYGGDMYNPVVESIGHAYQQMGMSTLRFNFRGVGLSQGVYSQGIGEREDVLSAIDCLNHLGASDIGLTGYSFGAWVNAHVKPMEKDITFMTMVSPPVAFLDFKAVTSLPHLRLVISGNRDEIAPADKIQNLIPVWNSNAVFEKIEGADHFYFGFFRDLERILMTFLAS